MEAKPSYVSKNRRNSLSSIAGLSSDGTFIRRSKSYMDLSTCSLNSWNLDDDFKNELKQLRQQKRVNVKCINGCGTPLSSKEDKFSCSDKSSKLDDVDFDEEDDFIADHLDSDFGAILSTPALLLPNYYLEKVFFIIILFAKY